MSTSPTDPQSNPNSTWGGPMPINPLQDDYAMANSLTPSSPTQMWGADSINTQQGMNSNPLSTPVENTINPISDPTSSMANQPNNTYGNSNQTPNSLSDTVSTMSTPQNPAPTEPMMSTWGSQAMPVNNASDQVSPPVAENTGLMNDTVASMDSPAATMSNPMNNMSPDQTPAPTEPMMSTWGSQAMPVINVPNPVSLPVAGNTGMMNDTVASMDSSAGTMPNPMNNMAPDQAPAPTEPMMSTWGSQDDSVSEPISNEAMASPANPYPQDMGSAQNMQPNTSAPSSGLIDDLMQMDSDESAQPNVQDLPITPIGDAPVMDS